MQCEGHVGKFVQAGVDVPGRPRHSVARGQSNPAYPWNDDLTAQAAFDLPSEKAHKSRRAMISRQRMSTQKASNLAHLNKHRYRRRRCVTESIANHSVPVKYPVSTTSPSTPHCTTGACPRLKGSLPELRFELAASFQIEALNSINGFADIVFRNVRSQELRGRGM